MNASTLITLLILHDIGNSPAGNDLALLEDMDLVACKDRAWRLTPRGEAHVKQLLNTPLPVQVWASADGEAIV